MCEAREFLESKEIELLRDFRSELAALDSYCLLGDMNFAGCHLPDYRRRVIQQYYLLRFLPAYFVEYRRMFQRIIQRGFVQPDYRVLSLGTGCGLDYFGLMFAVAEACSPAASLQAAAETVSYTGIDRVDWAYREDFGNAHCAYLQRDLTRMEALPAADCNILMFPKSVGEFDEDGWRKLCQLMARTQFSADRLVLAASLREMRCLPDSGRVEELVTFLCQSQGYRVAAAPIESRAGMRGDGHFSDYCPDFFLLPEVKTVTKNLFQRCPQAAVPGHVCHCEGRWPISKFSHVEYRIIELIKEAA